MCGLLYRCVSGLVFLCDINILGLFILSLLCVSGKIAAFFVHVEDDMLSTSSFQTFTLFSSESDHFLGKQCCHTSECT